MFATIMRDYNTVEKCWPDDPEDAVVCNRLLRKWYYDLSGNCTQEEITRNGASDGKSI